MTIDPEMLMAYADGELDALAAGRVERAIAADPALAREVERHRAFSGRVAASFAPIVEAPVPDRLAALLQSNVVPLVGTPAAGPRRWMTGMAIAASLVIGIAVGRTIVPQAADGGTEGRASAGLARALESQLASAQAAEADTRIGLTFRATDGEWCRSFEQSAAAGIACRDDAGWGLRHWTATPRADSAYRQANANAIAEAAQAMMAGAPLDAPRERAARDSNWR